MKKILSVSLCALLLLGALPLLAAPARALTADIVATPNAPTAAVGDNFSWVVNPSPSTAVYVYKRKLHKDNVVIYGTEVFNSNYHTMNYQFLQPGVYKPYFTVRDMNSTAEITISGSEVTVRYLPAPVLSIPVPSGTLGTSLAVAWTPVAGAASYQLLRADAPDGVYSLVATTTAAAFQDTGLLPGTAYYYKVAAFITVGVIDYQSSEWSAPKAGTTLRPAGTPDAPSAAASSPLGTSLKLTWASLSGADAYRVLRAGGSNGAYRVIRVTRLTYLYDAGLTPGRRYAYRIIPLANVGGAYYPSGAASAPRVAAPMGAAAFTSATAAGRDRARLSWAAAPGAAAYRVWVSKSPASGYALARTTAATALTVTGLDPNTPYYFKVQPYSQAYPLVFDGPMSGYRAVRTLK